jgi:nicotinamide mononucleotide adenylyltransferase
MGRKRIYSDEERKERAKAAAKAWRQANPDKAKAAAKKVRDDARAYRELIAKGIISHDS